MMILEVVILLVQHLQLNYSPIPIPMIVLKLVILDGSGIMEMAFVLYNKMDVHHQSFLILLQETVKLNVLLDIGEIQTICPVYNNALQVNMDMKAQLKEHVISPYSYLLVLLHFMLILYLINSLQYAKQVL